MEVKSEIGRVSAARAQGVEESTLSNSTLQGVFVGCETKSEEVERVGAVGLGSYVDSGIGVDVGRWSEDDLRIRRAIILTTY